MNPDQLPLYLQHLLHLPSFPRHDGQATIECVGDRSTPLSQFARQVRDRFHPEQPDLADLTLPAFVFATITGQCLVAVRGDRTLFSKNFGTNLRVAGEFEGRKFAFHAPRFYCRPSPGFGKGEEWVLFEPVNEAAVLEYTTTSTVAEVRAAQLNFTVQADSERPAPPLSVVAEGRAITFRPVPLSSDLLRLLDAGAHESAPTTEIRFSAWPGAAEQDLSRLAWRVARFCGFVAQQPTNLVRVTQHGQDGRPISTEFHPSVRSGFRSNYLLFGLDIPHGGLARFFAECFDEFVRLECHPSWRRLFNMAWCYEDAVYLETRAGTLLGAVELLIRTVLTEQNVFSEARCEKMHLKGLIGAAQDRLGWTIPEHFTALDRYRHLRNATAHAHPLPFDTREVLDIHQKWGLFLYRRLFLRLGYTGPIRSASRGYSSMSDVSDFGEDENSFLTSREQS